MNRILVVGYVPIRFLSSWDHFIDALLFQLLDPLRADMAPTRYKAIGDLKTDFGETAEVLIRNVNKVSATVDKLWQLYDKNTFAKQLGYGLERMDRVLELTEQVVTLH